MNSARFLRPDPAEDQGIASDRPRAKLLEHWWTQKPQREPASTWKHDIVAVSEHISGEATLRSENGAVLLCEFAHGAEPSRQELPASLVVVSPLDARRLLHPEHDWTVAPDDCRGEMYLLTESTEHD